MGKNDNRKTPKMRRRKSLKKFKIRLRNKISASSKKSGG